MEIGNMIRQKRTDIGYTQEQLAEVFGVSPQAISRWENSSTYPDISLLPSIAMFFHISVDELLGMDKLRDKEELDSIHQRVHEQIETKNIDTAIKELRKGLKQYPNNYGLLCELALALTMYKEYSVPEETLKEALHISYRILDNCTDDKIRSTTKANVCFINYNLKDFDTAHKQGSTLPHIWESREILLPYLTQEYDHRLFKRNINTIINLLYGVVTKQQTVPKLLMLSPNENKKISLIDKFNKIVEYMN